jgi:hypothetical protein
MQQSDKNPLIEPENYFAGYDKSMKAYRNDPKTIEWDKLIFDVFAHYEPGKKFLELAIERYLIPALVSKGPTYTVDVLWQEGFKDFLRMIVGCIKAHEQRIAAEQK